MYRNDCCNQTASKPVMTTERRDPVAFDGVIGRLSNIVDRLDNTLCGYQAVNDRFLGANTSDVPCGTPPTSVSATVLDGLFNHIDRLEGLTSRLQEQLMRANTIV